MAASREERVRLVDEDMTEEDNANVTIDVGCIIVKDANGLYRIYKKEMESDKITFRNTIASCAKCYSNRRKKLNNTKAVFIGTKLYTPSEHNCEMLSSKEAEKFRQSLADKHGYVTSEPLSTRRSTGPASKRKASDSSKLHNK